MSKRGSQFGNEETNDVKWLSIELNMRHFVGRRAWELTGNLRPRARSYARQAADFRESATVFETSACTSGAAR